MTMVDMPDELEPGASVAEDRSGRSIDTFQAEGTNPVLSILCNRGPEIRMILELFGDKVADFKLSNGLNVSEVPLALLFRPGDRQGDGCVGHLSFNAGSPIRGEASVDGVAVVDAAHFERVWNLLAGGGKFRILVGISLVGLNRVGNSLVWNPDQSYFLPVRQLGLSFLKVAD